MSGGANEDYDDVRRENLSRESISVWERRATHDIRGRERPRFEPVQVVIDWSDTLLGPTFDEAAVGNYVYACMQRLFESAEHRGLIHGNGHHIAQTFAEQAKQAWRAHRQEGKRG